MPELPEVETTRLGISPFLLDQKIIDVIIRQHQLRWPIPKEIATHLKNQKILTINRRGKYLLITLKSGTLIIHLGMSGNLQVLPEKSLAKKHDHFDLKLSNHKILRYHDPRRFGAILWTTADPLQHPLLKEIGPEPLSKSFNANYLWKKTRNKKVAIKNFIMNNKVIAGCGNIYAVESLFLAGIYPKKSAGKMTHAQCIELTKAIKKVLRHAIRQGGTTIRDFITPEGKPGYFAVKLKAYGRSGEKCVRCKTILQSIRLGQRATVYCQRCQK